MIFVVRTTGGQEYNVARFVEIRARMKNLPIKAIVVTNKLKGYVIIEADNPYIVREATQGLRNVRSRLPAALKLDEVKRLLVEEKVVDVLKIGDTIEVVAGPFKGYKARVDRINRKREELTIQLLTTGITTLPITLRADQVQPLKKRGGT